MGSQFRLSAGFRRNTTPHCFKLSKLESDYLSFRSVRFNKDDLPLFDIMPRIDRVFCSCSSQEDRPLVSAV